MKKIIIISCLVLMMAGCDFFTTKWSYTAKVFDGEVWIRATDVANLMALSGQFKFSVKEFNEKCNSLLAKKETPNVQ